MTVEEKYPLLIGHSLAGRTRLHNIQEVANFICTHGQYGDLVITERDGTPFLNTFGIYIDKISDMEYREKLLKVLIPMQMEIDGTNDIDKTNETEEQNMNKLEAERRFAQRMKDNYPPGTRIMLLQMGDDPHPIEPNTRGTVEVVDDIIPMFTWWSTPQEKNRISPNLVYGISRRRLPVRFFVTIFCRCMWSRQTSEMS